MLKPGYKTTEFVIAILTDVGALAAALSGNLAPRWAGFVAAISTAAYSLARGLAKLSPPPVATTYPVQVTPPTTAPPQA